MSWQGHLDNVHQDQPINRGRGLPFTAPGSFDTGGGRPRLGTRIKNTTKRMVQNLRKTDSATAARGFAYQIVSYVAPFEAAKNMLQGKCAMHPQGWGRCAPASTSVMNQLSNDGEDLDDTSFQIGQIAGDIAVLTFAIVAFPGAGIGGPARAGNIAKTARAAKNSPRQQDAGQEKSQSLVA